LKRRTSFRFPAEQYTVRFSRAAYFFSGSDTGNAGRNVPGFLLGRPVGAVVVASARPNPAATLVWRATTAATIRSDGRPSKNPARSLPRSGVGCPEKNTRSRNPNRYCSAGKRKRRASLQAYDLPANVKISALKGLSGVAVKSLPSSTV